MSIDDDNESPSGQNFDPRELLRTARDYWLLALILAIPAGIGFYYWKKSEVPVYASSALIFFEVSKENVVNLPDVVNPTPGGEELENILAHLRSRGFLQEVVDSLSDEEAEKVTLPYREEGVGNSPSPLGIISTGFRFGMTGQGTTLRLSCEHRDPEVAALIVNRILDQFTVFLTRRAANANNSAIKFLMAEADELRQKVKESDLVLQKYREDNNVISLPDSQNLVEKSLSRVSSAVSEAYLARLQAEGVLKRTNEALENGENIAKIPAVMSYADVRAVLSQINALEAEISVLSLRYGSRHPTMIARREVLEQTRNNLNNLVEESKEYLEGQAIAAIENHERLLEEQSALEKKSLELDRLGIEFSVLKSRYDSDRLTYDRIVARLNEAIISNKLVQSPIRVIDYASTPGRPIRPDPQKIVVSSVGLFVGVFGGIIGFFALVDRRIRSGGIIEDRLGVELLGEVPDLKGIRERDRMRLVSDNLDLGLAEGFRSVCGKILLAGRHPSPKSLLLTSSAPGEGKSLFCANLAFTLREQGKRILMVNADFRAPALDEVVGERQPVGISEWYSRDVNLPGLGRELADYRVSLANGVDFLAVGEESIQPQEILSDSRFLSAIAALGRDYDYTLIDAPPGLVFHDAIGLADWVTETVVVVRYLNATVARVKRLVGMLEKTRSRKLGIVLNGVPASQSNDGYYRHARRYYDKDRKSRKKSGKEERKTGLARFESSIESNTVSPAMASSE